MENKKNLSFKLPKTVGHKEARKTICDLVRNLNDRGELEPADIPQLHRMATAYDTYLSCVDIISAKGLTMTNLKGELVKRPEANLLRESWSQYLELAKEYGFTAKSKRFLKGPSGEKDTTPADEYFKNKAQQNGK